MLLGSVITLRDFKSQVPYSKASCASFTRISYFRHFTFPLDGECISGHYFSLKEPALDENLSLPEGNQAGVLRLLLIAHISLNFCLEVESETKVHEASSEEGNCSIY